MLSRFLSLALIAILALAACATPPLIGPGGGAAAGQEADGKAGTFEPKVALTQPGAIGDATNTDLRYQRQEQGSQTAPQLVLNLQPGDGATASASYPALTTIVFAPVILMANSQRDESLSSEQIEKVKDVTKEAGAAVKGVLDASKAGVLDAAAAKTVPK